MTEDKNQRAPQIRITQYNGKSSPLTDGIRNRKEDSSIAKRLVWVMGVIGIVFIMSALYLYLHAQSQIKDLKNNLKQQQNDPTAKAKEDQRQLVDEVGKLIILPADEDPTIATVSDLNKLKGQPFFNNAQIGDKVLIYSQAKKAILFRPSEHKIIELAPISSQAGNTNTQSNLTP